MRRGDRGAATVEFALVVPLFFLVLGIAGYFAWQVYTEAQLNRAAQRAARYAAVPATDGTYAFGQCDVVAAVNGHLTSMSVPAGGVVVSDRDATLAPAACPSGPAATAPHGFVHVEVTYELDNPFADVLTFLMHRQHPLVLTGSGEAAVEEPT